MMTIRKPSIFLEKLIARLASKWRGGSMDGLTQVEFGRRLKAARERKTYSEAFAATQTGLTEAEIKAVESGTRKVSTLEFETFVDLYGRSHASYFAAEDPEQTMVTAVWRSVASLGFSEEADLASRRCLRIYHQLKSLMKICSVTQVAAQAYAEGAPRSAREAVRQGREAAARERKRCGLGFHPIDDLCDWIEAQGVGVGLARFPDDVSGLMLAQPGEAPLIFANSSEHAVRRSFSLAHEYAHVLFDRAEHAGLFSRTSERDTLIEARANAFASSLLLPDGGVHAHLASIGKYRRAVIAPHRGAIEPEDVLALAARFHVSRVVVLLQLKRLKFVDERQYRDLIERTEGQADRSPFDHTGARRRFHKGYIALAKKAFAMEAISWRKLVEALSLVMDVADAEREAERCERDGEETVGNAA